MTEPCHANLPTALQADIECTSLALELDDGYVTPMYRIRPACGLSTRTVVYVHGIQSHPGWFVGSCQALAKAGCEVFAPTRRGSGENAISRGDCRGYRQLLDDVECAVRFALAHSGRAAAAMVGVSWGGKLATLYCLERSAADERPSAIDSLVLVAPGIAAQVRVPLRTRLAVALAVILQPGRRFDIPLSDPALFTDNPAMREYLKTDPHRLHQATARFLLHSAIMDVRLRRSVGSRWHSLSRLCSAGPKPRAVTLQTPTTLLLAARDRIIDNAATRRAVERLTAGQANVVELPAAHTMDFEPEPKPFYDALTRAVSPHETRD